jgi:hypothetical protein
MESIIEILNEKTISELSSMLKEYIDNRAEGEANMKFTYDV